MAASRNDSSSGLRRVGIGAVLVDNSTMAAADMVLAPGYLHLSVNAMLTYGCLFVYTANKTALMYDS